MGEGVEMTRKEVQMDINQQLQKSVRRLQKNGDEKAAEFIINHYYHEIYCYMFKQTIDKELAMDLTQEIFVSMLQTVKNYDAQKAGFRTWLYRIATNKVVDYYRSRSFQQAQVVQMLEEDLASEEDFSLDIERKIELEQIIACVNQLDVTRQKIFRLKIFGEYTFDEIANLLKIPESTVKTKYYATQRLIRTQFQQGGFST